MVLSFIKTWWWALVIGVLVLGPTMTKSLNTTFVTVGSQALVILVDGAKSAGPALQKGFSDSPAATAPTKTASAAPKTK